MANKKHLAWLQQGVKAWNAWRAAHPNIAEIMTTAAGEPPRSGQPRPTGHEPRLHQK
jgi:hypothetical protein